MAGLLLLTIHRPFLVVRTTARDQLPSLCKAASLLLGPHLPSSVFACSLALCQPADLSVLQLTLHVDFTTRGAQPVLPHPEGHSLHAQPCVPLLQAKTCGTRTTSFARGTMSQPTPSARCGTGAWAGLAQNKCRGWAALQAPGLGGSCLTGFPRSACSRLAHPWRQQST